MIPLPFTPLTKTITQRVTLAKSKLKEIPFGEAEWLRPSVLQSSFLNENPHLIPRTGLDFHGSGGAAGMGY